MHVILLSVLLALGAASSPAPAASRPAPEASPQRISPDELFSRRALRQARLLIQMRMLQLRDEQLECVRDALRRRLPQPLWQEIPSPTQRAVNVTEAVTRCADLMRF